MTKGKVDWSEVGPELLEAARLVLAVRDPFYQGAVSEDEADDGLQQIIWQIEKKKISRASWEK